ncbi:hypothetical protein B0H15DRAFT_871177, partial [Mycena belliarum]
ARVRASPSPRPARRNGIPHSSPVPAAFESRPRGVQLGRELPRPRADTPRSPAAARPLVGQRRASTAPPPPHPARRRSASTRSQADVPAQSISAHVRIAASRPAQRTQAVYGRSGAVKRVSRPVPPHPPQRSPPQRTSALPPSLRTLKSAPTRRRRRSQRHPTPHVPAPHHVVRPIKRPLAHAAQTPGTRRRSPSRPPTHIGRCVAVRARSARASRVAGRGTGGARGNAATESAMSARARSNARTLLAGDRGPRAACGNAARRGSAGTQHAAGQRDGEAPASGAVWGGPGRCDFGRESGRVRRKDT